jgi:hypothetical protein
MNFLFRRPPGGHVFMTTQDPTYLYKVLCGHCDYPIEDDDKLCPRCQLELEDCPVCREETHKKARKVSGDPLTGAKTCPVCQTRRVPFGGQPLLEIEGFFCRNLYGCRAGGLLLHNEEFAVLRANASRCPICKHEELTPLDMKIFLYLVSRCLFCNSVYGPLHSWKQNEWSKTWVASVESLRETSSNDVTPCNLCGRRDRLVPAGEASDGSKTEMVDISNESDAKPTTIPALHYLKVVELGRALILEKNSNQSFQRLFDSWFQPSRFNDPEVPVRVGEVCRHLLEGTVDKPIQRILRGRVEEMLKAWGERLPGVGSNYPVEARGRGGKK